MMAEPKSALCRITRELLHTNVARKQDFQAGSSGVCNAQKSSFSLHNAVQSRPLLSLFL